MLLNKQIKEEEESGFPISRLKEIHSGVISKAKSKPTLK